MRWQLATAVVLSAATLNGCTCEPPVPVVHVSPGTTVFVGDLVTFDSNGVEGDPDDHTDAATNFHWDLDGDGKFEVDGGRVVQMRYTQPGTYKTTVDEVNPTPDGEGLSVHLGELVHGYLTTTIIVQPPKGSPGGPPANQPPTASFTAGDAYTERDTTFDASGSTDGDGSVVKYEWDWEADGTYDETHTTPTTTHKYEFGGPHTVRLRVTDDDGATGTTANTIQVCDCVPPAKVIAREAAGLSAARAGVPFKLKLDQLKLTPGITTVGGSRLV